MSRTAKEVKEIMLNSKNYRKYLAKREDLIEDIDDKILAAAKKGLYQVEIKEINECAAMRLLHYYFDLGYNAFYDHARAHIIISWTQRGENV